MSSDLRAMLAIPRPRTRADCRQEARPCPWVGCRHHLLLEIASRKLDAKDPRATTIRLNLPPRSRRLEGRRPGLASGDAEQIVRSWMEDALEAMTWMSETCALDVVDVYPDGLPPTAIARLLGVTPAAIEQEIRIATIKMRAGLAAHAPMAQSGDGPEVGPSSGNSAIGRS